MKVTFTHNSRMVLAQVASDIPQAVSAAADALTDGLKTDLRQTVTSAGLGIRLANTWRGQRYPQGRASLNAAAFVWSKAPDIIDAFDRGATILPLGGKKYLAIPTENVPARTRGGGFGGHGSHMNPFEVQVAFNQDLKFAKTKKGVLIAFVNAVTAKNKRGFRPPTARRLASGRQAQMVVMFILVPSSQMPKKFDIDTIANRWADRTQGLLDDAIAT